MTSLMLNFLVSVSNTNNYSGKSTSSSSSAAATVGPGIGLFSHKHDDWDYRHDSPPTSDSEDAETYRDRMRRKHRQTIAARFAEAGRVAAVAPWSPTTPSFSEGDFDKIVYGRMMILPMLRLYRPQDGVRALNLQVNLWLAHIEDPYFQSFMKERFHPAQSISFLTLKLRNEMDWMVGKVGLPAYSQDVLSLREYIDAGFKAAGVIGVKGFIKTSSKTEEARQARKHPVYQRPRIYSSKASSMASSYRAPKKFAPRKTCRAVFNLAPQSALKNKRTEFKYHPDRIRAIKCLSKLVGRMHLYWPAWISAKAAPIAKTGLVTLLLDSVLADMGETKETFLTKYPATALFIATTVSTFSQRKAFTLESQKQGKLNEFQLAIFELVKRHEPAALRIIALILPIEEIFSTIPQEDAVRIYKESMKWLKLCGLFYREQFFKGVNKCVRRLGRVPPKGSKINVTAVNNVADAWMNLRRFQTISAKYGRIEGAPTILKIMQLIADDQFRMGGGVRIEPNAHIYKGLTTQKVYPWDAVLAPESFDIRRALTILIEQCRKFHVDVESWIGIAKLRTGHTAAPVDMICGVAVAPMSRECADWLVSMGLFGAHAWEGK